MIIATIPFNPSRMVKTFNEVYAVQEEMGKNIGDPGWIDKAKMAVKATGVSMVTEIGIMLMV